VSDSRFELIAFQLQVSAWGFRFAKLLLSFTLDSSGLNGPQVPRVFWTCSLLVKRVRASTGLAGTRNRCSVLLCATGCARFFPAEGRGFEPRGRCRLAAFRERFLAVRSSLHGEW
jgi:hypothetical protein